VAEWKATMSQEEFIEWVAFWEIDPKPKVLFELWMRKLSALLYFLFFREKKDEKEFSLWKMEPVKPMTPEDQWENLSRYMEHIQKHGR
jgi:hypothetical protein